MKIIIISRQAGEGADRKCVLGDFLLDEIEKLIIKIISEYYDLKMVDINSGAPIDISFMDEYNINGLIYYGQAGQEGGTALSELLFNKINFSGKLTFAWPQNYYQITSSSIFSHESDPKIQQYSDGIYVGFRYFTTFKLKPKYQFEYGLSYTSFMTKTEDIQYEHGMVHMTINVRNNGLYSGKDVVQIYMTLPLKEKGTEL